MKANQMTKFPNLIVILLTLIIMTSPTMINASGSLAKALEYSDNFEANRDAFIKLSQKVLDSGKCTLADFKENGGWAKATGSNAKKPVYFIYCGGFTLSDKVYLNISSGRVWK